MLQITIVTDYFRGVGREPLPTYRSRKGDVWIVLYVDEVITVALEREELDFVKRSWAEVLDMNASGSLGSFLVSNLIETQWGRAVSLAARFRRIR